MPTALATFPTADCSPAQTLFELELIPIILHTMLPEGLLDPSGFSHVQCMMFICVWELVYTYTCTHKDGGRNHPPVILPPYPLRQRLPLSHTQSSDETSRLASQLALGILSPSEGGIPGGLPCTPGIYMASRDVISGPHTCKANTF